MKSQVNYIIIIVITGIIVLSFILYFIITYNNITNKYIPENQYSLTIQNSVDLLSYINNDSVNQSYSFLLSYLSTSENNEYCINDNTCTNITQDLYNYFDSIYGNNWNLTIYYLPSITGWIVQMFLVTGNIYDWDSCEINPPNNTNGVQWYQWNYNTSYINDYTETVYSPEYSVSYAYQGAEYENIHGAGWVNATAPFHEDNSCGSWGLGGLYGPYFCTSEAEISGFCTSLSTLFPGEDFTNASVFCQNGNWELFQDLDDGWMVPVAPNYTLPSFFYGQYIVVGGAYSGEGYYYPNPPIYKTATDITQLAQDLGLINSGSSIVGSFYRGKVYIPPSCQDVYIDYPWHEVIRLYISYLNSTGQPDYIFLAAAPYCTVSTTNGGILTCPVGVFQNIENVSGIIVGKQCPLVYQINQNENSAGLYEFNITKWAIINRDPNNPYIIISAAYWDPHPGSNGIAMPRVFCTTSNGNVYELNAYLYNGQGNSISLGYPIPKNQNLYTYYFYLPIPKLNLGGYLVGVLDTW
ncbi:hypothetical protein MJ1_0107 [Nanobdella aerobiophila]|uniref:Uncharacterized protein n=1 Tax=Nanobdella aerobiophila TaxID=2586965 RepID=A0A915WSJ8_9ARCH|nr:hypothetical protein [Nanobdella aerobiophila]BBL45282.1 hypothetical protein MJ1_0107 [Nanobdella aerobiophila]